MRHGREGSLAVALALALPATAAAGPMIADGRSHLPVADWTIRPTGADAIDSTYRGFDGTRRRVRLFVPRFARAHPWRIPLLIVNRGGATDPFGPELTRVAAPFAERYGALVVVPQGTSSASRLAPRQPIVSSWANPGQIADLARMPAVADQLLAARGAPLRVDRSRVDALGPSMGGHELLMLVARYPDLLRRAVAVGAPTNWRAQVEFLRASGRATGALARETGDGRRLSTPEAARRIAERDPSELRWFARIVRSRTALAFVYSPSDARVRAHDDLQSGAYARRLAAAGKGVLVCRNAYGHTGVLDERFATPQLARLLGYRRGRLSVRRLCNEPAVGALTCSGLRWSFAWVGPGTTGTCRPPARHVVGGPR